jgi:hypothetical protein
VDLNEKAHVFRRTWCIKIPPAEPFEGSVTEITGTADELEEYLVKFAQPFIPPTPTPVVSSGNKTDKEASPVQKELDRLWDEYIKSVELGSREQCAELLTRVNKYALQIKERSKYKPKVAQSSPLGSNERKVWSVFDRDRERARLWDEFDKIKTSGTCDQRAAILERIHAIN